MNDYVKNLETRIEELEEQLKITTEALTKIAKSDTQMWAIDALRMMMEKNDE